MSINLLKTYNDMIKSSNITQKDIDAVHNSIYMDYFLRPDLKLYQRPTKNSKGEITDGFCIYPDEQCICELLNNLQNSLDEKRLEASEINPTGMIIYLLEKINAGIINYFGSVQNTNSVDTMFYADANSGETLAKLSDFKGKNCAECIERALAAHTVLCVFANDVEIKRRGLFPYTPFIHVTSYQGHVDKSSSAGGHAVCGLISHDENKTMYLFDPTNYGKIKQNKKEMPAYGIYELTGEEAKTLFEGGAVEPQLIYARHIEGVEQTSHRAFSKRPSEFKKLMEKYKNNDFSR